MMAMFIGTGVLLHIERCPCAVLLSGHESEGTLSICPGIYFSQVVQNVVS